jgi:hypothetical protein
MKLNYVIDNLIDLETMLERLNTRPLNQLEESIEDARKVVASIIYKVESLNNQEKGQ